VCCSVLQCVAACCSMLHMDVCDTHRYVLGRGGVHTEVAQKYGVWGGFDYWAASIIGLFCRI